MLDYASRSAWALPLFVESAEAIRSVRFGLTGDDEDTLHRLRRQEEDRLDAQIARARAG